MITEKSKTSQSANYKEKRVNSSLKYHQSQIICQVARGTERKQTVRRRRLLAVQRARRRKDSATNNNLLWVGGCKP